MADETPPPTVDRVHRFVVISDAGPHRDLSLPAREQPFWDEHAAFIDRLVDAGFIELGGPFDDGGAMIVVVGPSESAVRETLAPDPWYQHGILTLISIRPWEMFINQIG